MRPIFSDKGKLNILCFGSGSGTTIEAIIAAQQKHNYSVKAILADRQCRCIEVAEQHNIPLIYNSKKRFLRKAEKPTGEQLESYDKLNLESIASLEKENGFRTDLVCLAGYLAILTKPMLHAYMDRMINSHPADLSILNPDGSRKYAGLYGHHAVRAAALNGDKGTRTCIIMVNEGVDQGEVLVTSRLLPFRKGFDPSSESDLKGHLELQKKHCDYPAYIKALELISSGRISVGSGSKGKRPVYLDSQKLGAQGVLL